MSQDNQQQKSRNSRKIKQSQLRSGLLSARTSRHLPITSCMKPNARGSFLSSSSSGEQNQQSQKLLSAQRSKWLSSLEKQKGSRLFISSLAITPNENMSFFDEKDELSMGQQVSGAPQGIVNPGIKSSLQTSLWYDSPKSMILTIIDLVIITFCGLRSRWQTLQSLRNRIPWTSMSRIKVFEAGERVQRWRYMYSDRLGFEMQSQKRVLFCAASLSGTQYLGTYNAFPFLICFKIAFSCKTLLLDWAGLFSSLLKTTAFLNMFSLLKVWLLSAMTSFSEPEKTYQYQISVKKMWENPPEPILVRFSLSGLLILMQLRMQLFSKRFLHFASAGGFILLEIEESSCQLKKIQPRFLAETALQQSESCSSSDWEGFIKFYRIFYIFNFYAAYPFTILDSARLFEEMLSPVPIFGMVLLIFLSCGLECASSLDTKWDSVMVPVRRVSRYSFNCSNLQNLLTKLLKRSSHPSSKTTHPLNNTILTTPL